MFLQFLLLFLFSSIFIIKKTNYDYKYIQNSEKPFLCQKCERTFNSKYNVIRHLKQYHADTRAFKCLICDKDYKWIDSLHKHMKMHKLQEQKQQQELEQQQLFVNTPPSVLIPSE